MVKPLIPIFVSITFIVSMFFPQAGDAAVWSITYPRPINDGDKRHEYPLEVLKLALDKTGVRYKLQPSDRIMLQAKSIRQLRENRAINVIWVMTNKQRESELLPIRIPIAKGLIGWRVFLINRGDESRFSSISSLRELQQYAPIQGIDWPDTKILQANGFSVATVGDFFKAYTTLEKRQGDFFPRSVIEITKELEYLGRGRGIDLEKNLIMHYPAALYFFVNKSNKTLATLIETGLMKAVDSGEYDKLFTATFESILEDLALEQRQVFRLSNPLLPDETPVNNTRFWFDIYD